MSRATVFIHTNHKQMLGAHVARYCLKKYSSRPDEFDVRFIELKDYPALSSRNGQAYLRNGVETRWDNEDLQSFTPLRFLPPQLVNYKGRAIVIDPDIFALGDIMDLLEMDMKGKAILCRHIPATNKRPAYHASSVMLLDCSKLRHWNWEESIEELFNGQRDYTQWMNLALEPPDTIGPLAEEWNSFDKLTPETRLLHNTRRGTQPWKTGLAVDYSKGDKPPKAWKKLRKLHLLPAPDTRLGAPILRLFRKHISRQAEQRYVQHPDPNQVSFFFRTLAECLEKGALDRDFLQQEINAGHVRPDALEMLKQYAA